MSAALDGIFRLRFEYESETDGTTRSEHVYGAGFASLADAAAALSKKAAELHAKVIGSLKEDGIIAPPDNVIHVDFQRRKRA
jgi:hypothetical protein